MTMHDVPPPPPSEPATPIAREVAAAAERVFLRVAERVEASNAEVRAALKHILDELLRVKREVEELKVRVTAHDAQLAALVLAKPRKGARRAAAKSR